MPDRYAVAVGRFQPLHLGHEEYLRATEAEGVRLIVAVTNPDPGYLPATIGHRALPEANPWGFWHRRQMILSSFPYAIVLPAPVNEGSDLISACYLPPPEQTLICITIYDLWGSQKVALFEEMGYDVKVLWERDDSTRLTSGRTVRRLMRAGQPWQHLVSPGVAAYILGNDLTSQLSEE